jgi:hypothetical protein
MHAHSFSLQPFRCDAYTADPSLRGPFRCSRSPISHPYLRPPTPMRPMRSSRMLSGPLSTVAADPVQDGLLPAPLFSMRPQCSRSFRLTDPRLRVPVPCGASSAIQCSTRLSHAAARLLSAVAPSFAVQSAPASIAALPHQSFPSASTLNPLSTNPVPPPQSRPSQASLSRSVAAIPIRLLSPRRVSPPEPPPLLAIAASRLLETPSVTYPSQPVAARASDCFAIEAPRIRCRQCIPLSINSTPFVPTAAIAFHTSRSPCIRRPCCPSIAVHRTRFLSQPI